MLKATCERCNWTFAVEDFMAARDDRCPQCGHPVFVPGGAVLPPFADWGNRHPLPQPFLTSCQTGSQAVGISWLAVLQTESNKMAYRVSKKALEAYIHAIAATVSGLLTQLPRKQGADLVVARTMVPRPNFHAYMLPEAFLSHETLVTLFKRLLALPAPAVRTGEVAFLMPFALWGGSGQITEFLEACGVTRDAGRLTEGPRTLACSSLGLTSSSSGAALRL